MRERLNVYRRKDDIWIPNFEDRFSIAIRIGADIVLIASLWFFHKKKFRVLYNSNLVK